MRLAAANARCHSRSPFHGGQSGTHPASASLAIFSLRDCASSARRLIWLGTLPPAAWPDSPAFRPLHFTAASATGGGTLSLHFDGRKQSRPDETGRVPKMAARLRPARNELARDAARGQDAVIRREALPIAEDNSTARLCPVQATSIIRETGQLLVASLIFHCASSVPERCTPKIGRTHCENQFRPTPRRWASRPAGSGLTLSPANWSSFRYAPASGSR